jgi:16S rRNA (cytosine1402-N4)-methyltransferase
MDAVGIDRLHLPPEMPVCRCGHRASLKLLTRGGVKPADDEIARNLREPAALS